MGQIRVIKRATIEMQPWCKIHYPMKTIVKLIGLTEQYNFIASRVLFSLFNNKAEIFCADAAAVVPHCPKVSKG
jgi:hypothetical protein